MSHRSKRFGLVLFLPIYEERMLTKFKELRLADYQLGWGKKVQTVPKSTAKEEIPGAFPLSSEKGGDGSEGGS